MNLMCLISFRPKLTQQKESLPDEGNDDKPNKQRFNKIANSQEIDRRIRENVIGTLKDVGHGSVSVKPDGTVTFTMYSYHFTVYKGYYISSDNVSSLITLKSSTH